MTFAPTAISAPKQSESAPGQPPADTPTAGQDWDTLFRAVTDRLREIAGVAAMLPDLAGIPPLPRGQVLECAQALEHLRELLLRQRAQQAALLLPQQQRPASAQGEFEASHVDGADETDETDAVDNRDGDTRQRHRAQQDALTALPNRSHFRDLLRQALEKTELERPSLALMYLDLDGFKPINDQHGQAVGDRMLRIVASRLTRAIRSGDKVGRMGGDEFACLLGDIENREQLSHLACKLFDAVSSPLQIGKLQLTVRPSIGIAVCPTDGGTADTLLKRADAAMYRAKRAQSGYAFFDRRTDLGESTPASGP